MSLLKQFRVGRVQNAEIDRALQDVKSTLDTVTNSPILNGKQFTVNLQIPGIPVKVFHGLKRIPLGYIIAGQTTSGAVFSTKRSTEFLELQCSAPVVVDVIIY